VARPLSLFRAGLRPVRASLLLQPETESIDAPPEGRPTDGAGLVVCPVCSNLAPAGDAACPHCGFPFSCDITAPDVRPQQRRMAVWRVVLGTMALLFLLSGGLFYHSGEDAYYGQTLDTLAHLQPDTANAVPLSGPPEFVTRTQYALGLLKWRAPDFYRRFEASVTRVDYLSPQQLNSPLGRAVRMEGIGAVSTPAARRVQVMPLTVFPDGDGLTDRAVFNYAAVLVHELRHIELHWSQQAPGGWQEEVLCEQAALAFEQEAGAPPGLIADKQMYLADPTNKRYQGWYDWYKQFK
jgi:hypothetical protein